MRCERMGRSRRRWLGLLLANSVVLIPTVGQSQSVVPLPAGVKAVWNLAQAYRETTPTRERICLNGLWRWQPAAPEVIRNADTTAVPSNRWGFFKVPGCWPGLTDYMQKDCQTVYPHPDWRGQNLRNVTAAWYQREVTIPSNWIGRRVTLSLAYLNSFAAVYVDGRKSGEIRFPAGEVDLTSFCRPGEKHLLSLFVVAMPLKGVLLSYTDSASAKEVKGSVARRGLCGDVYLAGAPPGARVAGVKVDTSVRRGEITFGAALEGLAAEAGYTLRARITDHGQGVATFTSKPFAGRDLSEGRMAFTEKWKPDRLWDSHTPLNQFEAEVSLVEAGGRALDTAWPERFGFREFWIDGRDFYLNGTRIFLSALPLDNAQVGAAWATYAGARESLERLRSIGINFVYTHNYGCEPGSHLSFEETLRAADDTGMLVALSQPHFSHYDWKSPDADQANGYARHAAFYVRVAQNHPSVVAYAMSHNATGYNEDMNPDMIDGIQDSRDRWASNNVRLALRAEAIVKRLDPGRIVYHHASGNLGSMHVVNFYPNFAPVQELSDWCEHWATKGIKPFFLCEYGGPFSWDWTMYRGWYRGRREFGSAAVPWEFCLAEWNAQFFGEEAYRISDMEKKNLRWDAKQFRAGKLWHRWDYPYAVGSSALHERDPVFAKYITDNWRAYRTWGLSGNSPWEYSILWSLRDGVDRSRQDLPVDWEHLQRPGFSPDYVGERYERMDLAYAASDWIPTTGGEALIRNNRPLLAYLGGKPARFTSKDHNVYPGESIEKQIIVINNSRETVACDCVWSLALPGAVRGRTNLIVRTGDQARVPLRFDLPAALAAGSYELTLKVRFENGETQSDSFRFDVLARPSRPELDSNVKLALFDPRGETAALLAGLGVRCQPVDAQADLSGFSVLIVGKSALTVDGPAPDVRRVREGLKVVLFEQTPDVLEKRFGFRVEEYGLRQVFKRVPDHPLLAGLDEEHLRDWRGESTILPPRLKYELNPKFNGAPTVRWCDIPVTRIWRCGNRGNVASVLIEKPACGNFLPILDGGFSLQYSPLLEYREGRGLVLFCQLDVTGRTEADPAAEILARNILAYVATAKPRPARSLLYVGDSAGRTHLQSAGFSPGAYEGGNLSTGRVLVVGPGGGPKLAESKEAVAEFLKAGGNLLALGLDEREANAFLPITVAMKKAEHISSYFPAPSANSLLAGIGPADVHNRDPREVDLVSGGAVAVGDGILAAAGKGNLIFCQMVPWRFEQEKQMNLKRTFRRASFLVTRLLGNLGASSATPVLDRFHRPVDAARPEQRWLTGLYLDQPTDWDDPYRFFRW
jgi:beta-galactosidase